ncbi:uncharacterized protein LOC118205476, partial [Stegodyphus dumicola]|uniref:uncharacterized protein LOC118205476 n=1 Tax=Stegodyphus dumicola TaxID=202533 RepID=UPI0015AE3E90
NQLTRPTLLQNLEKEYENQQDKLQTFLEKEHQIASASTKPKYNFERGDHEAEMQNKDINEKQQSFVSSKLEQFEEQFERIKEVTQVSDIQEADARFIAQKTMHEDLFDLKKKAIKRLHDLREEKRQLDTKMGLLRDANAACPKRELEDELITSKARQNEQEKRRQVAKMELDRINFLIADIRTALQKLWKLLAEGFTTV